MLAMVWMFAYSTKTVSVSDLRSGRQVYGSNMEALGPRELAAVNTSATGAFSLSPSLCRTDSLLDLCLFFPLFPLDSFLLETPSMHL